MYLKASCCLLRLKANILQETGKNKAVKIKKEAIIRKEENDEAKKAKSIKQLRK